MSAYGFKDSENATWNGLALLYVACGYGIGLVALIHGGLVASILGTLWLAHSMTIAAYLLHECGHNAVFRTNAQNARLGTVLTWITGSCYGTYEDIRVQHFRHHVDSAGRPMRGAPVFDMIDVSVRTRPGYCAATV